MVRRSFSRLQPSRELYAEVRDEITAILSVEIAREGNDLSAEDGARRATFERLVALVGAAFAVSPVAIGFFGINISGWTSGRGRSFPAASGIAATTMGFGLRSAGR